MTAPTTLHSTRSVAARALRTFILVYQAARAGRSPVCRFVPSCSEYALEAIREFRRTPRSRARRAPPVEMPSGRPVRA